jgi:L-rhamnose mutarotase
MKRFCLALDLKDDPALIAEYEALHKAVWPENIAGIQASGITDLQIYRIGNRMFMMIEANDDFTFERKAELDAANPRETLTWKYQQALPWAKPGEKWMLMEQIFKL